MLCEIDNIDASMLSHYLKNGASDSQVNLIPLTPLNYLSFAQPTFLYKKTLLPHDCEKLRIMVDQNRKHHPEIAGE